MDVDMEMDMDGGRAEGMFKCWGCGRRVCGTCAVVGDERFCLGCATSGRRW